MGLWAGCTGDTSTLGSSGGGGGGGGGAGVISLALKNGATGYYKGVTLSTTTAWGGNAVAATDTVNGDATVYGVVIPPTVGTSFEIWLCQGFMGCNGVTSGCTTPGGCNSAQWPTWGAMQAWTVEFDLSVDVPANEVNNITFNAGPNQCLTGTPVQYGFFPNFVHNSVKLSALPATGNCLPKYNNAAAPVSEFFALTLQAAETSTAGTMYVNDVKWMN